VISAVISNVIDRKQHESKILISQKNADNLNTITSMSIGKSTLPAACREISKLLNNLINSDKSYLILSDGRKNTEVFSQGRKISNSDSNIRFSKICCKVTFRIILSSTQGNLRKRFIKKR